MKLKRCALITGAAHGLGRAMTMGLAADGFLIVALDRDSEALANLQTEFSVAGKHGQLTTITADFELDSFDHILSAIRGNAPPIDILVNNAGVGSGAIRRDYHTRPARFWEVSAAQWQRFFAINTHPAFFLSSALAPFMMERNWGRIVNVTTSLGSMLRGGYAPYGPSKAAVEALTAIMASDLNGSGVTANVLIPGGAADTPLVPAEAPFKRQDLLPASVMIEPLRWLASDESSSTTGQRFLAVNWDSQLPKAEAAQKCGAPAAWRSLATLPILPKGSSAFGANPS